MRVRAVVLMGCLVLSGAAGVPQAAGQATDADSPPAAAPGMPVTTEPGQLQGVSDGGLSIFRGVPYAAAPVGALRWRPPQPVKAWEGVRHAERYSPKCPQNGAYPPEAPPEPMSEDCLYLNLWVPTHAAGPLPVMVWFHGGELETGSASVPLYAGDQLATHGVIVVTANYRLGALGFLAHRSLSQESPQHVSGNYGLLDQIAALQWVHRNIAAFGGDPHQVTVFAQSSGSIALSALAASPLTEGLFQRAIGESGGLFEPLALDPGSWLHGAEAEGAAFAKSAGAQDLNALRRLPVAELLKLPFRAHLVIDGSALPEPPYDAYVDADVQGLDLLLGYNLTEGAIFLQGRRVTPTNFVSVLSQDFPPLLVRLLAPFAPDNDASAAADAVAWEGDLRFRWDMWSWGRLAAALGDGHVYVYEFAHAPPFAPGSRYFGMGATHGMELPYVFGHLEPGAAAWTGEDRALSAAMQTYWTNFAKSGNPNAPGLPPWRGWPAPQEEVMRLGAPMGMEPLPNPRALRSIDRTYWVARKLSSHPRLSAAAAFAVLIAAGTGVIVLVRRRRSHR